MGVSFRPLRADEIEVRVGRVYQYGVDLLLYKTARTDQDMLDEVVGPENWQCSYEQIGGQLFCTVSVWSDERGQWISKQDVGSPSNVEAEKGRASDARKRAGFAWGIGRELYTAPRIFVNNTNCNIKKGNDGKLKCYDLFSVPQVTIEDHEIMHIVIRNDTNGRDVFEWPKASGEQTSVQLNRMRMEINRMIAELSEAKGVSHETVMNALYNSAAAKANGIAGEEGVTSIELAEVLLNQLRKWSESIGGRK